MKFRTEITIAKQKDQINYNSKIALFGSCFTENMEKHFNYFKFENTTNSHGIIFNPKSIEKAIHDCVNQKKYSQNDLNYYDDIWLSFSHHTKFSSAYLAQILNQINQNISNAHHTLLNASHVLITLGTSWIYRYKETENLVANCHKIPQSNFIKEILSVEEITETLGQIIALIRQVNKETTIIFTVSPVRHLKDGFIENTQSKASLHTAIQNTINNKTTFYFPSFEIMMDDLRDYRFYKNDLTHPNDSAMEYIWEKFRSAWIEEKAYPVMKNIDAIQKSLNHIPFREDSEKHQKFLKNLNTKIKTIAKQYPQISFKKKTV